MSLQATSTAAMETEENVKGMFVEAVRAFRNFFAKERERQRLLEILQNDKFRSVLTATLNEADVIEAFTWASAKNDVDILQAFYDIGMNVDAKDRNGNTALFDASSTDKEKSVRWLLDHDANIDFQNNSGATALICASMNEKSAVAELLLQRNANPDILDIADRTAMMLACSHRRKDIVQLLLNHNADTSIRDKQGKTALDDYAKEEEIKEMIRNHVSTSYVLK